MLRRFQNQYYIALLLVIISMPVAKIVNAISYKDIENTNPRLQMIDRIYHSNTVEKAGKIITKVELDAAQKNLQIAEAKKMEEEKKATPPSKEKMPNVPVEEVTRPKVTDLVGMNLGMRMYFNFTTTADFKATETRTINQSSLTRTVDLFAGNLQYTMLPSFSVFAGDEFRHWYKWEMELAYMPLITSTISNFATDTVNNPNSNFAQDKSYFNMHFLNLSTNHFLKVPILDDTFMLFAGLGIGVGYIFPGNPNFLLGDFALPTIQAFAGTQFAFDNNSKVSIFYRMLFSNTILHNRMPFADANASSGGLNNNRPIQDATLSITNIFIHGIGVEYVFFL